MVGRLFLIIRWLLKIIKSAYFSKLQHLSDGPAKWLGRIMGSWRESRWRLQHLPIKTIDFIVFVIIMTIEILIIM